MALGAVFIRNSSGKRSEFLFYESTIALLVRAETQSRGAAEKTENRGRSCESSKALKTRRGPERREVGQELGDGVPS